MTQQQLPIRKTSERTHYTTIEGTKTMKARGWHYEYVDINNYTLAITVGREEGNYAGGTWLRPYDDQYEEKLDRFLDYIQENDPIFYDLIIKELQMRKKNN